MTAKRGRSKIMPKGVKVTLYMDTAVRDYGKQTAAAQGISFSELVTRALRGKTLQTPSVPLVDVDGVMVPADFIHPMYRSCVKARRLPKVREFRGKRYKHGAAVLYAPIDPRPGDSVLLKDDTLAVLDTESTESPETREVEGVILRTFEVLGQSGDAQ